MQTIAISVDQDTLDAIDRIAAGGGAPMEGGARRRGRKARISRSQVVREALRRYADLLERQQREERDRAALTRHKVKLNRQAALLVDEQALP